MTEKALDLRGLTEGALNVIREDLDAAQAGTKEVPTKHLIAYADNLWHMVRALQEQISFHRRALERIKAISAVDGVSPKLDRCYIIARNELKEDETNA